MANAKTMYYTYRNALNSTSSVKNVTLWDNLSPHAQDAWRQVATKYEEVNND